MTFPLVEVVLLLLDVLECGLLLLQFELKSPGGLFDFRFSSANSSGGVIVGLFIKSVIFLVYYFVEASPSELDSEILFRVFLPLMLT